MQAAKYFIEIHTQSKKLLIKSKSLSIANSTNKAFYYLRKGTIVTKEEQEKYIREYVATTRQHFATYHNHKEQMAYGATALYLTATSVFFFQKWLSNTPCDGWCKFNTLFVINLFSLGAILFVYRQLALRSIAVNIITACDICRLQWLKGFSLQDINLCSAVYRPYKYLNIDIPQFLYDKIPQEKINKSTKRLQRLLLITMIFEFIVINIHISRL